jgi:transcriptional regulator GlxA family with amidase domain
MQLDGAAAAAARLAAVASACSRFSTASVDREDPRLIAAVAELARSDEGAVRVAALARRVGLGASQLRRLFARRYGCSPTAWLVRRRLERARELLAATDLPVQEVARACGFADPFWFSRLFRRENGASPASWRGRARAASS